MILSEIKTGETATILRVCYSSPIVTEEPKELDTAKVYTAVGLPGGRLNILLEKIDPSKDFTDENSFDAATLKDAEKLYIEKILSININEIDLAVDENRDPMQAYINRGCNLIAARSRRGAGNVVLCNPSSRNLLGDLYKDIAVEENTAVPEKTFIVLYRGENKCDTTAFFFEDEKKLFLAPNSPNALGNWEDYVYALKIV
jgi:hypothetical protein